MGRNLNNNHLYILNGFWFFVPQEIWAKNSNKNYLNWEEINQYIKPAKIQIKTEDFKFKDDLVSAGLFLDICVAWSLCSSNWFSMESYPFSSSSSIIEHQSGKLLNLPVKILSSTTINNLWVGEQIKKSLAKSLTAKQQQQQSSLILWNNQRLISKQC